MTSNVQIQSSENANNGNNINGSEYSQIVRKMESSYVRVPFEQFKRAFRQEMKIAEKDLPGLEGLIRKHLSASGDGEEVSANVLQALRDRIQGLKARFEECRGESVKYRERFLKRLRWVETMAARGNYQTWSRSRVLRLICDFLLRRGELDCVRGLIEKRVELGDEVDLELEESRQLLLKSLRDRDLGSVLVWCGDHRVNLKKLGSDFEFRVRQQEFIEHLKGGRISDALKVSQKHFPAWLDSNYRDIRETLALLCWLPFLQSSVPWSNGLMSKYESLMGESRWSALEDHFMQVFVRVYQLDRSPQLVKTVRTGLSVLKTRKCSCVPSEQQETECPACSGPLSRIAQDLPFGHFETTRLRCRITGKLMTEDNPPMALPNGQVYSSEGLQGLINGPGGGGGVLKCPVSGESFYLSEARKCFFL